MSQLRTYFLGPFDAERDGISITGFESDKMRWLLAYLVVEAGRPHRREALAALLWPAQPDTAARQSLRRALYVLRHTLQQHPLPVLTVTRQTVQLNPDADGLVRRACVQQPTGRLQRAQTPSVTWSRPL